MELFKGINQIKVPLPRAGQDSINVYIVEGSNGNLMIDTGWNTTEAFNALAQEMKNSGFAMKDITQIVVTHLHPDHFGLAGKIAGLAGAAVSFSAIENNFMESRYNHPEEFLKETSAFLKSHGVPDYELKMLAEASMNIRNNVTPVTPASLLQAGDKIQMDPYEFEVLVTPGHSPGHICLYEPNKKYLFSGDHLLMESAPNITYHPQSGENPLGEYIDSLNKVAELDIRFILPGHGPVFSGVAPKIDAIMGHHKDRMMKIEKAMGVEMKSGFDVAREIPWIVNGEPLPYNKLDAIDRRLSLLDTLAHLQYMVAENNGKKVNEGEKTLYWTGG